MIDPSVSFILASASLRRAELLTAAGFLFEIVPADVDETPLTGEPAKTYALGVARAKAEEVSRRSSEEWEEWRVKRDPASLERRGFLCGACGEVETKEELVRR